MDVTMQTSMNNAAANAKATASGSGSTAGSKLTAKVSDLMGGGKGGFLSSFNSMISGTPAEQTGASVVLLPELVQLIHSVLPNMKEVQSGEQPTIQEVNGLLSKLLEALEGGNDHADLLVSSASLQQLLAQIQAFLLTLQKQPAQTSLSELSGQGDAASDLLLNSGVSETLDNNLFVPLSHPALENSKASTGPNNQMIPLQDAKELLAVFSAVLPFAADREEVAQIGSNLQRLVGELPKLLAGKTNDQQAIANVMDGTLSVEKTEESDGERIVAVAPVKSKLELLAAKAVIPEAVMKQAVQQVAVDSRQHSAQGMQSANQPVQIDDLLKTMNPKDDIFAAKTAVPEAVTKQAVQQVAVDSQPNSAEDMQSANLPVQINDLLKTVNPKDDIIKLPSQPVPVQRFSEEMAQFVVKNLKITLANGISEAKISLAPEHLGNVDVKITIHNGQVVAQFMADSVSGKEMLESQLAQLRTNLQNQGIQVHKLEVTQNQSLQSGMFQDPRQQQSQQQSNRQTKGKNNAGFDVLDEDAIQEVIHSLRNVGDGNSFDVTA